MCGCLCVGPFFSPSRRSHTRTVEYTNALFTPSLPFLSPPSPPLPFHPLFVSLCVFKVKRKRTETTTTTPQNKTKQPPRLLNIGVPLPSEMSRLSRGRLFPRPFRPSSFVSDFDLQSIFSLFCFAVQGSFVLLRVRHIVLTLFSFFIPLFLFRFVLIYFLFSFFVSFLLCL